MRVKDHFLSKEYFDITETEVPGVLKTSPIPENIGRYYESNAYISHHQDSGSLKEKLYKFIQKFNLNYKRNIVAKEIHRNANVLDYGCGSGDFIKFMEEDFSTFAFEPNSTAREAAVRKALHTTFVNDISELHDQSLEAVTMWHVFEHIENQDTVINEIHNKLINNGKLIIAVPNHSSYDAKYYKEYWAAYDVPRHIYHFNREGMINLFSNNRWQIKTVRPLLFDSYYISILSEKYRKNPLFFIFGSIIGAISNIKASKTGQFSSLIYVIEKK